MRVDADESSVTDASWGASGIVEADGDGLELAEANGVGVRDGLADAVREALRL